MPNNRPPTIADVARHAVSSIATVSRILNGTTPVQPEKVNQVHQAARVLASTQTNTVDLLLSEISGAFLSLMLKRIEACNTGSVRLAYDRQEPTIKDSGNWHANVIRGNSAAD